MKNYLHIITCLLFSIVAVQGCKHPPGTIYVPPVDPASTQYPIEVANIIVNKCATAGCHNAASYTGAANLRLDDWQYMFDGSVNGAVAVPYCPENSSILYFLNPADSAYDNVSAKPTMPYNLSPLSKDEYNIIKNWIANGAPDKNGNIPFAANAGTRQKIYQTQQGCDWIAVIDAEKKVVMRYIRAGKVSGGIPEVPHNIQTDKPGAYTYVCFTNGTVIQKIDCNTDAVVSEANLGDKNYNVMLVSENGKKLVATQLIGGRVTTVNTETMQVTPIASLVNPHGIAANPGFDTFYITAQYGNAVYRVVQGSGYKLISIDGKPAVTVHVDNSPDPHEIMMAPDYSKYFVTCENTHEVRVMDRLADTVLKAIPVGTKPQEMAISTTYPYLFVTCMEDVSQTSSLFKGSVYVIDYNTFQVIKRIDGDFYQPHGVAVDDRNGTFYIASRNINPTGPAPHHQSSCGGRNGYYHVYSMATLAPVNNRRYEITPDPYSMSTRFKN